MRTPLSLHHAEEGGDATGANRWLVSYADFMTLLFVLFLALYALVPKLQPKPIAPANDDSVTPLIALKVQQQKQTLFRDSKSLIQGIMDTGHATIKETPDSVVIEVSDTSMFDSGTAKLTPAATSFVTSLSELVKDRATQVRVEGHTDNQPIQSTSYPSNWELSSARASSVVRIMEESGVSSARLFAIGRADAVPKGDNNVEEGRAMNRRVSITMHIAAEPPPKKLSLDGPILSIEGAPLN
jgi:chemotaxis protein MotB